MAEPFLAKRMAPGELGEISLVVDQAQIQLLGRPLIVQPDQAVHHLLKILAPLEEIGLQALQIAGFHQLLQPHLIPALAHAELEGIGEGRDPVARQAGRWFRIHPFPEALEDHRLLLGGEGHPLTQLAQQDLLGHRAQDAVLEQKLSQGPAGHGFDTGQQFGFEGWAFEHQALAEPDTLSDRLSRSVTASARSWPVPPRLSSTDCMATLLLLRLLLA